MLRAVLVLPALFTLALRPAPQPAAGPGAVMAMQRDLFAAIDRGDGEAARSFVASDRKGPGGMTTLFLIDRAGTLVRATDSGSARDALARLAGESKVAGGSFATKITMESADCPSSDLSYAVIEFERVHTLDGKVDTRRYRGTLLVRHEESGWKVTHWHVSPGSGAE